MKKKKRKRIAKIERRLLKLLKPKMILSKFGMKRKGGTIRFCRSTPFLPIPKGEK